MLDASDRRKAFLFLVLFLLASIASPVRAAKVVLYKSFFGTTPVCLTGGMLVDPTCAATADGRMTDNGQGWLRLVLPDSIVSDSFRSVQFTLNRQGTWSNEYLGTVTLQPLFLTADTVWMVPDPYPGGNSLKLTTTDPLGPGKVKVVMFWPPWSGQTPRIQVGAVWDTMTAMGSNTDLRGWYSQTIVGYSAATTVLFANTARTEYLSGAGLGTANAPAIGLDSIARNSDTVWIRAWPEIASTGVRSTAQVQKPRQLMVFNPWNGSFPAIQQPRIRFGNEDTLRVLQASADYCGWYTIPYFERTATFVLVNRVTGQTFGAGGYGTTTPIDAMSIGDTAWVTVGRDSLPRLAPTPSIERGVCEITYLAATVRDFPSGRSMDSPLYNREFGRGRGCWQGNWQGVKGMVDTLLGPDRKPVRSAHDTGAFYPNGWTYSFRCSFDDAPGYAAEIGDSGIATNWFRTVEGKNAETCRDIPLTLDATSGNYAHNSPQYFPIDDFTKLPSGADNPYYDRVQGEDGKGHNFGFCLESHGNFEYKKGQTFKFRGDDDVWFYINNRLVVDLGGIHGPWSDSVLLDTIGRVITTRRVGNVDVRDTTWTTARLEVDQTYNFDFFFCERNPQGSSMRIETSMNLRTSNGFQVRDTLRAPGRTSYDLYVSQTSGQGCKAQNLVAKVTGRFFLSGPGIAGRLLPGGATYYGGITISAENSRAIVDSVSILGLPAGEYFITAVSDFDSTQTERIRFVVPFTIGPRFIAPSPRTLPTGASFAVQVGAFNALGADSSAIPFVLQAPAGLVFYRDSTLLSPLSAGDTLMTGANTVPRRLWVRGILPGTYTMAVGKIAGDSADFWRDIVFLAARPVFADRTPWTGTVGSVLPLDVVSVNDLGIDSSATAFRLRPLPGVEYWADSLFTRPLAANDTLVTGTDGRARRVWVRGLVAGSVSIVVTNVGGDSTDSRGPVVFLDKGLRFIDALGAPIAPVAISLPLGDTLRLHFETIAGGSLCTSCGSRVRLVASVPGIEFLDASGLAVDTTDLRLGRGSILIRGTAPVAAASLLFQVVGDAANATWSPVAITVAGPDSASIHDLDGDGRADALLVHLHQAWTATNQFGLRWPEAADAAVLGAPTVSADSMSVAFAVSGTPLATRSSLLDAGAWSWAPGSPVVAFAVADRIAPVPVRAVASAGSGTLPDTLRILLSESVIAPDVVEIRSAGDFAPTTGATATSGGLVLTLLFPTGTGPRPGDSARLSTSASDALGNHPGTPRRAVPVEGASPPPLRGWLLDLDGDGAIDHARVLHPAPVDPAGAGSYAFAIGSEPLVRRGTAPAAVVGRPDLLEFVLETPFPRDLTSFPPGAVGILHREGLPSLDGPVSRDDLFPLADSVPPGIRSATLRLTESYDKPDTLLVVATEPVAASGPRLLRHFDGATESVLDAPDARWVAADTLTILLWPWQTTTVRAGDSVRWIDDGTVVDTLGNVPLARARRVVVNGGVRPPLLRMLPPRPMTRIEEDDLALVPVTPGVQVLGGSPDAPFRVDPISGLPQGGTPCPETRCVGPEFELNQPVRVSLMVYDLLGTSVASIDVDISETTLKTIGTDRLGRTKVRLSWDLSDDRGRAVASGVYLMRVLVWNEDLLDRGLLTNQVWKIGVNRPAKR